MAFSHLLGNPAAKQLLTTLLEKQKLPSVLLFSGLKGVGKSLFARALAFRLLNTTKSQPADFHHYAPQGKSELHTMDAVQQMLQEVALPPFEAPCKVFILEEAEKMLPASSNALLKTLEEPPADTYFLLVTDQPEQLLPTLVSRSRCVNFFPVASDQITKLLEQKFQLTDEEKTRVILRAQGSIAKALQLAENKETRVELLIRELFEKRNLSILKELDELVETQEQENALFEEIALFFREKDPASLSRLLPLLERSRLALSRHTKLSVVLQALFFEMQK